MLVSSILPQLSSHTEAQGLERFSELLLRATLILPGRHFFGVCRSTKPKEKEQGAASEAPSGTVDSNTTLLLHELRLSLTWLLFTSSVLSDAQNTSRVQVLWDACCCVLADPVVVAITPSFFAWLLAELLLCPTLSPK